MHVVLTNYQIKLLNKHDYFFHFQYKNVCLAYSSALKSDIKKVVNQHSDNNMLIVEKNIVFIQINNLDVICFCVLQ